MEKSRGIKHLVRARIEVVIRLVSRLEHLTALMRTLGRGFGCPVGTVCFEFGKSAVQDCRGEEDRATLRRSLMVKDIVILVCQTGIADDLS